MEGTSELRGRIEKVRFRGQDHWHILDVQRDGGQIVCAKGVMPNPMVGDQVTLIGRMERSQYGEEFAFSGYQANRSGSVSETVSWLVATLGIDVTAGARIVEALGPGAREILYANPLKLADLNIGELDAAKLQALAQKLRRALGSERLAKDAASFGIPIGWFNRLAERVGGDPSETVERNPYALFIYLPGARFSVIDKFARSRMRRDAPARIQAGVVFVLRRRALGGHTYIDMQALPSYVAKALALKVEQVDKTIRAAVSALDDMGVVQQLGERLHLTELYRAEAHIAERLKVMIRAEPLAHYDYSRERVYALLAKKFLHDMTAEDQKFLDALLATKVSTIHGAAAAHATLLPRAIAEFAQLVDLNVLIVSPTRAGAERVCAEGVKALSIDQALGLDSAGRYQFGPKNPLPAEAILVLEADRLTVPELSALLGAAQDGARIWLLGDVARVPPTGPGWPFADLVQCDWVAHLSLPESLNFVPPARRPLAAMLKLILAGKPIRETVSPAVGPVLYFPIKATETDEALRLLVQNVLPSLGLHPARDAVAILPARQGKTLSVDVLNEKLRHLLVAKPTEPLQPGEPIILDSDVADAGLRFGERGEIEAVDGDALRVRFGGTRRRLTPAEVGINPGYATTVYQASSIAPLVSVALFLAEHELALNRRVLYTALSACRDRTIVLAEPAALQAALQRDALTRRDGYLAEFLRAFKSKDPL